MKDGGPANWREVTFGWTLRGPHVIQSGHIRFEGMDSLIKLRERDSHQCFRFFKLIPQFFTLILQFMTDHIMPFSNLSDVAAERFSHNTEVSLDLFHLFMTHGPNV